jgi:hypothetical protein
MQGNGGTLDLKNNPESCQSPIPYLFTPKPPLLSGKGMNPIEIYWNMFTGGDDMMYQATQEDQEVLQTEPFECPIPCRTAFPPLRSRMRNGK